MFGRWESCLLLSMSVLLTLLTQSEAKINYKLEFEGIETYKNPSNLLQIKLFRVAKYNRTDYVVNLEATSTRDWPRDAIISVVGYEKMASNKYSQIPVKLLKAPFCQMIESEKMFYPGVLAYSNLPEKCPVKKGPFLVTNYIADMGPLPDRLPGGDRWRVNTSVISPSEGIIYKTTLYVYINRKM